MATLKQKQTRSISQSTYSKPTAKTTLAKVGKNRSTTSTNASKSSSFAPVGSLFAGFQLEDAGGYITREFQDYGYRLALALDDLPHKSLYIKMAKEIPRGHLERALSYVSDAAAVKSKAKLFMWRLRQLQQESNKKQLTPPERVQQSGT